MEHFSQLIGMAKQGDKDARNTLVQENTGLVWSIVKRFLGRGCEADDLFQIGVIGLLKAIDYFEESYQVKFSTYAVPMITGELRRYLRDNTMLKVSRSVKENLVLIKKCTKQLSDSLGREPVMDEIAEATGLCREDILTASEAGMEVESLHKVIYQGDGSSIELMDRIEDETNANEKLINHVFVKEMLQELGDKERQIIVGRYFEQKTQSQLARELGMTQVQVSRMEKKILQGMRTKLA